jgi:hypothetical protein
MDKIKRISEKGFEPITSQQMYRIENNGEEILGMRKILMMENAGSRVSDFLLDHFKDLSKKKLCPSAVWEIMEGMQWLPTAIFQGT